VPTPALQGIFKNQAFLAIPPKSRLHFKENLAKNIIPLEIKKRLSLDRPLTIKIPKEDHYDTLPYRTFYLDRLDKSLPMC
jgi:hypothetical protein